MNMMMMQMSRPTASKMGAGEAPMRSFMRLLGLGCAALRLPLVVMAGAVQQLEMLLGLLLPVARLGLWLGVAASCCTPCLMPLPGASMTLTGKNWATTWLWC
jgi:hypothetical protein